MKVTCQSCQAKYTIADEKVRGKVAKIRCKKCGTTIIVNGTDGTTSMLPASTGASSSGRVKLGADEQWAVLIADGDQRTLKPSQITELYVAGAITYDTPAWKDGMTDWLPILQIDALKTLLDHGPRPALAPDFVGQALASVLPEAAPPSSLPPLPPMGQAPASRPPLPPRMYTSEPAAARRRPRAASTDLFGAAVQDEVMTSASTHPMPQMPNAAQERPTGARNENSVLFSLSALTGGQMSSSKPAPAADKDPVSSRADLRALVTGGDARSGPTKSKIDDIINLSGGGVYSPAMLTAPLLAPPPVERAMAGDMLLTEKRKGSGLVKALVAGVVLVGGAALAYATIGNRGDSPSRPAAIASASATVETPTPSTEATKQPSEPAAASAETAASAAPTVVAPGQNAAKPEGEKKTVAAKVDKSEKAERYKADTADKEKTAPASAPPSPAALGVPSPAPVAHEAPAPAAGGSGDFDRAAALSTLSAAASAAQACKKSDGPTGQGRIAVTYANNGQATTANLEGPPFAGTPVGGCVAARFRGTHVPPFGGAPITVHKTFNIN